MSALRRGTLCLLALALCALAGARDLAPHDGVLRGAAAATYVVQPPMPDLQIGLLAYWSLRGGSGTSAADSGPGAHHGTLVGSPTWGATYLALNGSSQRVTLPAGASIGGMPQISVAAWVYPTVSQLGEVWVENTADAAAGRVRCGLYLSTARLPSLAWRGASVETSGSGVAITGAAAVPLNTWTLIVGTRDSDANDARLYVAGSQVAVSSGDIEETAATASNGILLGAQRIAATWGNYFAGRLSSVRLYNRILSAADRAALLAEGPP